MVLLPLLLVLLPLLLVLPPLLLVLHQLLKQLILHGAHSSSSLYKNVANTSSHLPTSGKYLVTETPKFRAPNFSISASPTGNLDQTLYSFGWSCNSGSGLGSSQFAQEALSSDAT